MIQLRNGDLFNNVRSGVIAHGVNCQGVMASGFAKAVTKHYPEAKEAYLDKAAKQGWKLGDIQEVYTGNGYVVNMATQDRYGRDALQYCDYEAIELCFKRLHKFMNDHCLVKLSIPRIGAGLGGGDWSVIESIIVKEFIDSDVNVTIWSM